MTIDDGEPSSSSVMTVLVLFTEAQTEMLKVLE